VLLYHGSDPMSLAALLNGADLDATAAAGRHRDGAPGFYLAFDVGDAEYFAARSGGAVVEVVIEDAAVAELLEAGALRQPIPETPMSAQFVGDELYVPTELFLQFNKMRKESRIDVVLRA
jgi:hypothetical protein